MKNFPTLMPIEICQAEIDEVLNKTGEGFDWAQEHRKAAHPTAASLKRIYLVMDYGPETVPMVLFAGSDPINRETWADTLAQAWNLVDEGHGRVS